MNEKKSLHFSTLQLNCSRLFYNLLLSVLSPRRGQSCPGITCAGSDRANRIKKRKEKKKQNATAKKQRTDASIPPSGSLREAAAEPRWRMSGTGGAAWIKFAGNVRKGVGTSEGRKKTRRAHSGGLSENQRVCRSAPSSGGFNLRITPVL